MPTDTKLNQLIINQLTQEQYDEAKAAGTLSDTELYITDSDDDAQVKSNLSQTIDDSTTKYPSNKAVKDESSRITTLMDTKITNCITYIPQDIKLELNNGTLTLKAGSKVYVPNEFEADGTTPKFDEVVIENDLTWSNSDNRKFILCYDYTNNQLFGNWKENALSGNSSNVPSNFFGYYYSVNTNLLYDYRNSVRDKKASFPICFITSNTSQITSIDQVFNGFGYIGSTVFALPGVKGLIPNGRNADGSLKSIEFTTSSVLTKTFTSTIGAFTGYAAFQVERSNFILSYDALNYWTYNEDKNIFEGQNEITGFCYISKIATDSTGKITSFTPKTVFHALDYNDKSTISGWSMPSSRYIDLTLGADGTTYVAPANGYFDVKKNFTSSGRYIWFRLYNSTNTVMDITFWGSNNGFIGAFIPVSKGSKVEIYYNTDGDTKLFRFIYAEGD